jgi:hypothetical protein
MTPFRPHAKGITVALRLTPGARKEAFGGLMEDGRGGFFRKTAGRTPRFFLFWRGNGTCRKMLFRCSPGKRGGKKSSWSGVKALPCWNG